MSTPPSFTADLHQLDAQTDHLRLCGELDLATAGQLRTALSQAQRPRLIIDLRDLQFLDSIGMKALLGTVRSYPDRHVAVYGATGPVLRVLDITALQDPLNLHATLKDAEAAVCDA